MTRRRDYGERVRDTEPPFHPLLTPPTLYDPPFSAACRCFRNLCSLPPLPTWPGVLNLYIVHPLPIRDDTREMAQEAFFSPPLSPLERGGTSSVVDNGGMGFLNYRYILFSFFFFPILSSSPFFFFSFRNEFSDDRKFVDTIVSVIRSKMVEEIVRVSVSIG